MDIDQENCLMFEWIKNVLEQDNLVLQTCPAEALEFKKFIKAFFDKKSAASAGTVCL